jgi:hypothetical protein
MSPEKGSKLFIDLVYNSWRYLLSKKLSRV